MISERDLRDRVAEWQLRDVVVEKDYVLGWVLGRGMVLAQPPIQ